MARPKKESADYDVGGMADFLIDELSKESMAGRTITAGDLRDYTYGIPIPHIVPQVAFGGISVIPSQRYISVSGPEKSMKSSFMKEIGVWFQLAGGLYDDIDNENKTSDTMFQALTCWRPEVNQRGRHHLTHTETVEEWQNHVSLVVKKIKSRPIPPKGRRIPVFINIDSLTGKGMSSTQEKIMDEGHAQGRSYDGAAMAGSTSQFFQALSMRGTTINIGTVRHQAELMDGTGRIKEAGAKRVAYQNSVNIRMLKIDTIAAASHPASFVDGPKVEGYTVRINPEASCLGSTIERAVDVDIIWQYVPQENGKRVQMMKFDWEGALGRMLHKMKYDPKKKAIEWEREFLDKTLFFTQGSNSKCVKCEELGLVDASFTEFGRAIESNAEVKARLQSYLNITEYPTFQDADIEADEPAG